MAIIIKKDESIFIPIKDEKIISDSHGRPRLYKTKEGFKRFSSNHPDGAEGVELVEYAPVRHGRWVKIRGVYRCVECHFVSGGETTYCPNCGVKMDGEGV